MRRPFLLSAALLLPEIACRPTPRARLDAALAHYAALSAAMAHDSVAALFTDDGELAGGGPAPLVGPAAIAAFLHTFSGYHVLHDELVADSSRIASDTAWQEGTYRQRVVVPAGDTVEVSGRFRITWRDLPKGGWKIRRMETYRPTP